MIVVRSLGALALAASCGWAAAADTCQPAMLTLVASDAGIEGVQAKKRLNPPTIVASTCKVLPYDQDVMAVMLAADTREAEVKAFAFALVDLKKHAVRARYVGQLTEDAALEVRDDSFRIDTANYRLNPTTRAIGLDVSMVGPRCADGGQGPMRTLYVQRGRDLLPVLEDMPMSSWHYETGNHCDTAPRKRIDVVRHKRAISMADSVSHGYRDLLITFSGETEATVDDEPVASKSKPLRPMTFKLSYDGTRYPASRIDAAERQWEGGRRR